MPSELKHVYCYQFGSDECYKVGLTKNPPEKRMRGFASGSPMKLKLYRVVETEYASSLEKHIHQLLDGKRTENGEFFHVDRQELDDAINEAEAFISESQPLLREAKKLSRKKPNDTMVDPTDETRDIYLQLRKANREKFLLERRIELLESKIQVAIGENCGMKGIASWKWVDRWTMNLARFKKEHENLFKEYKRNSGSRTFCLDRVDLTEN